MMTAVAVISFAPAAWAATGWHVTATPNPGVNGAYQQRPLTGVAASSAKNAWAVGNYNGPKGGAAMVLHWNGTTWTKAKVPAPTDHDGSLEAVAADGASTAYAVGYQGNASNGGLWLLHYNGRSWRAVNTSGAPRTLSIYGLAVHTIHHVWIVGYDRATNKPVALEWRSPGWTIAHLPLPPGATGGELNAAGFVPGTADLIAVGYTINSSDVESSYAVRFSGSSWHRLATPSSPKGPLRSIAVLSRSNAWAVGTRYPNNSSFQTLVEHWNGTRWSVVSSPNRRSASNTLLGIAAHSSSDLMAVGYSCAGTRCTTRTLTEQWNGHHWSIIPSKNPHTAGGDVDELFAAAAVSGTRDFWAVGAAGAARPAQGADLSLAEFYRG
jgi:hypothetical protein